MNTRCTPDIICLTCGNGGFSNAFVYCIKCLKVAVHRYCLDVVPNTVDEFVPWVCDDCDVEVQNQPAVCKLDAIQCKTRDHSTYKHVQVSECNMDGDFGEHDLDFEDNNVQHVKQESNIAQEMTWRRMIVRHSGHWEKSEYKDGDEQLVYMANEHLCREYILQEIHEIMQTDPTTADYLLFYITSTSDGRRIKVSLKSEYDLSRLLQEQKDELVVYVIEKTNVLDSHRSRVLPHINLSGPSTVVDDNIRHQDPTEDNDLSHEDGMVSMDDDKDKDKDKDEEEDEEEEEEEDEENNCQTELFESLVTEFSGWIREPGHIDTLLSSKTDRGVLNFSSSNLINVDGCVANDVVGMTSQSELRNWVIPLANTDNAVPLAWVEPSVANIGTLFVGAIFRRKDDLSIAVGMHHMRNRVECSVGHSCSKRLQFVCKHGKGCPFMLRAVARDGFWIVRKIDIEHTCHVYFNLPPPSQVSTRVIAAYFAQKMVNGGNVLKPKDMMLEVNREFGLQINYGSALRSRNIVLEMIYGDIGEYKKSYQRLPAYLYMLKQRNHKTIYDLHMTEDDRFCHMFLALGPCIDAFKHYLRPIIVVDGTPLKGKNKGVLFVAVTKDGNEQVFPLAVGISSVENDESWVWFLTRLRLAYGQPDDLVIVSDQKESIKNAVEAVFPGVVNGLCYYHLRNRMAKFGTHVTTIFQNAANSYRDEEFLKNLSALEVLSKCKAYKTLCSIGAHRWSRSQCPKRRFSFMTSNASMIFNAHMLWAKKLPICLLLEVLRTLTAKWFSERREAATSSDLVLTEEAAAKLSKYVEHRRCHTVLATTSHLWKVEVDNISFMVDLQHRTCDCREFDLDLLPCYHAAAVIRHAGLPVHEFVGDYYKQATLAETYKYEIFPLPHPDEWIVPTSVSSVTVQAPLIDGRVGCRKRNRAELGADSSSRRRGQVCSRCQGSGHNIRLCKAYVPIAGVDLSVSSEVVQPTMARKRQPKKCSICHETSHTRTKCPMRLRDNSD